VFESLPASSLVTIPVRSTLYPSASSYLTLRRFLARRLPAFGVRVPSCLILGHFSESFTPFSSPSSFLAQRRLLAQRLAALRCSSPVFESRVASLVIYPVRSPLYSSVSSFLTLRRLLAQRLPALRCSSPFLPPRSLLRFVYPFIQVFRRFERNVWQPYGVGVPSCLLLGHFSGCSPLYPSPSSYLTLCKLLAQRLPALWCSSPFLPPWSLIRFVHPFSSPSTSYNVT
jgi:hypothetical protein